MQKLIVQKYGGSSVADLRKIKRAAKRVVRVRKEGKAVVVVVSARGNATDELLKLARQITKHPSARELDMLVSTGEQVSGALLAMAVHALGCEAVSLAGPQIGIITDGIHTKAKILKIDEGRIKDYLKKGKIVIIAGFQGITAEQEVTTLGRGGSDLTAVAMARALEADVCEIYTDVEGAYTADPRIVREARKLDKINFEEMLELASSGAQVMQVRAVEFAKKFNVPIHLRSSFSEEKGTIISEEASDMEDVLVSGVTLNKEEAKVTICNVPDRPGTAAKIFKGISDAHINVDMIIQNISRTGRTDISFTVLRDDLSETMKITRALSKELGAGRVIRDPDIAKVSLVGVGMRSHPGVAAKMFETLAKKSINIEMISTSEIKISCVVKETDGEKAVRAIHRAFGLEFKKGTKAQRH